MELFNEVKNCYYTCMQNIINQIILDGEEFDSQSILECFSNNAYNIEDNIDSKTGDKFLKELFEERNNIKSVALLNESDGFWKPTIEEAVPIIFTKVELRYLKTLLDDSGFCALIGEQLYNKLVDNLSSIESFKWNKNCAFQGIRNTADNLLESELVDKIKIIIEAIIEEKSLIYKNIAKDGSEYKNGIPYRILFSPRTGRYQLIIITKEQDRPILVNIKNLTDVKLGEVYKDMHKRAAELIEVKKRWSDPLVLEVKDIYGSVERCFSLFSYYHKEAYYDENKKKHILKIYYYDFDKNELVRDILSLGDAVIVKSPDNIRQAVINRIRMAYFA